MRSHTQSRIKITVAVIGLLAPHLVFAHGADAPTPSSFLHAWEWDPAIVVPTMLTGWLYARGLRRCWTGNHIGRGIRTWEASAFAFGWLLLLLALCSPIHTLGQVLFSAHMTQHELLMIGAAPCLVLGNPALAFIKALPSSCARKVAILSHLNVARNVWLLVANPFAAFLLHGLALWIWHLPSLFQATLKHDSVHALQHLSFLGTALLFWRSLLATRHRPSMYGLAVLYLFATAMHSGLLGALITCASHTLYPVYALTAPAWGLTGLQDQQLGGLIMWIPAGLVYVVAALCLFAAWLRGSESRDPLFHSPVKLGGAYR